MHKATKIALALIILAVVGYLVAFVVPLPQNDSSMSLGAFRWSLANSVLYTFLHVGAAILFLDAISAYKAALRLAYIRIASGIVLVGIGLAQVVLLNAFSLLQSPWVQYGGVILPFLVAGLLIYFGTRAMARLVGVTSPATKPRIVLSLLLVCVVAAVLLPHAPSSLAEASFDVSSAINVWDVVLYAASLLIMLQIRGRIGTRYVDSMTWLTLGLLGSVSITTFVLAATFLKGDVPRSYLLDVLIILGGLLYLKAGHSFARTKEL
jgi:hypothetical protein